MTNIPECEALWFLGLVELGLIQIATTQDTDDALVVYTASNGWTLCVFSDCGEWDYIEWIRDHHRMWEYPCDGEDRTENEMQLMAYRPDDDICRNIYGSKGYWCTR